MNNRVMMMLLLVVLVAAVLAAVAFLRAPAGVENMEAGSPPHAVVQE
jgi:hypothetical protein